MVSVKGDSLLWGWTLLLLAAPTKATYWINQFDSYESLPKCAETPLSAIVRGMASGCGDGNARTSYDCFCSTSSSKFNNIIATAVEKACHHSGTEVDSATSLFSSYCQLGNEDTATSTDTAKGTQTTGTEPTTKRTQTVVSSTTDTQSDTHGTTTITTPLTSFTTSIASSTTSIVSTTSTSAVTAESSLGGSDLSTASKAAIGVSVPLGTLALIALVFLVYRRMRGSKTHHDTVNLQLERTQDQPKHWPMTSLSDTRSDSGGVDYFVAGSAPVGFRPPPSGNPFATPSPSTPSLVYEKVELDATSTTTTPKYELGETPRKYELP